MSEHLSVPTTIRQARPASLRATLLTVAALFLLNGVLLASWAAQIPLMRRALHLSDATLGVALAGLTLGSLLVLPLTSRALNHFGPRIVTVTGMLVAALALSSIGLTRTPTELLLTLTVFGAGFAAADVALNVVAVHLEHQLNRPVLSRLHGSYSLGAVLGAVLGGGVISLGLATTPHLAGIALLAWMVTLALREHLPSTGPFSNETVPYHIPRNA